jgi:hypothetical protein
LTPHRLSSAALWVRAGLGFIIGVAAAGVGLWLAPDATASGDVPPTVATTTTAGAAGGASEAPWVEGGVRFESTVVTPLDVEVDDVVTFAYRLEGLGTTSGSVPPVVPETWEMVLADGSVVDALSGPPRQTDDGTPIETAVRFEDTPGSIALDDVRRISVTGWRIAAPVETVFEVPTDEGSTVQVHDGTVVVLATIIEQATGTILDFDTTATPDPWRDEEDFVFGRSTTFRGDGPGWISSSSTIGGIGGIGGSTGFQLRWSERDVPDVIGVRYSTVVWTPLPGELVLMEGGDLVG